MAILLRTATPDDAHAIASVQIACWRSTYRGILADDLLDGMNLEGATARWSTVLPEPAQATWVTVAAAPGGPAGQDTRVVGFCNAGALRSPLAEYDAEIRALYLLPDFQRAGLGRRMMHTAADYLHEQNYKSLLLWVLGQNPAVGFYKRLGGLAVTGQMISMGSQRLPELAIGWPVLERLLAPDLQA